MTTAIKGMTDEYETRLRPLPLPVRGVLPVGECMDCGGEVYLADDEGLACCEACDLRWRLSFVMLVERL